MERGEGGVLAIVFVYICLLQGLFVHAHLCVWVNIIKQSLVSTDPTNPCHSIKTLPSQIQWYALSNLVSLASPKYSKIYFANHVSAK